MGGNYSFGSAGPRYKGMPMMGGLPSGLTKVYFVDYGNGSDGVGEKSNSVDRPFKTIDKALGLITTNKNEGIALMGSSTHTLTEMLTVSKSRTHIFGYDPGGRSFGQNAKVSLGVTGVATNIATILNTGTRNSFSNIKVINSDTVAQGLYAFAEGGEYTVFDSVEFYKDSLLTTAAAGEVLCNGDSAQFYNCTFGDLVNARGGSSKPRANVILTRETITGKVARDCEFHDCKFLQKALHADTNFVYGSGTTDVERRLLMVNPIFWNCVLASATIADGITFGGAVTTGDVLLVNPTGINVTAFAEASQNVYVTGAVPTAATTGIAVEVAA